MENEMNGWRRKYTGKNMYNSVYLEIHTTELHPPQCHNGANLVSYSPNAFPLRGFGSHPRSFDAKATTIASAAASQTAINPIPTDNNIYILFFSG